MRQSPVDESSTGRDRLLHTLQLTHPYDDNGSLPGFHSAVSEGFAVYVCPTGKLLHSEIAKFVTNNRTDEILHYFLHAR